MYGKSSEQAKWMESQRLVPAMLNRRRFTLKKILNRYMGLPFTQYQPVLSIDDICEAGLGDLFAQTANLLLPGVKPRKQVAETIPIEVRGVAIALDEEVSFSPYRLKSLHSPLYCLPLLPKLERYHQYCQQAADQEVSALTMVEKALKKRALHDFMQDMLPVVHHVPVLRLSVYDVYTEGNESCTLAEILASDNAFFYKAVAEDVALQLEEMDTLFLASY